MKAWILVPVAILGGVSGAALMVFVQSTASKAPAAVEARPEQRPLPASGNSIELERRIALLERGVAARAEAQAEPATAPGEAAKPEEAPPQEVEPSEAFRAVIDQHRNEPVDPSWAPQARDQFRNHFQAQGNAHGFTVVDVACKTTTCTAEIEWPSYDAALAGAAKLRGEREPMNCNVASFTPEPENTAKPYRQQLWYGCEDDRAGG